jgi:hypothetical protein
MYDYRLNAIMKVLLGKKCVCVRRREEHGRILYLVLCNGEWLKVVKCIIYSLFVLTFKKVGKVIPF